MSNKIHPKASEIARRYAEIKQLEAILNEHKAKLIEIVGDDGDKFESDFGTVTVTQRTFDRNTGMYTYSLDSAMFNTLDDRVQANLIKQGVVTKSEKITKGQAPVVKVALAK